MKQRPPLIKSFKYAFEGIFNCIRAERNIKIHITAAMLVTIAGAVLHISKTEWLICLLLFGLIIGLELMNTAVEAVVDLAADGKWYSLAKKAKDTAAGSVLIASIFAAIIGLIIFLPKVISFVRVLLI
ncbi:MAG: diacylglycerol kinase family protein [Lachnospiraceae bacterium]|nr:diacylglycerol kinase family protein [Lachnospiraceae bacterium]MEE3461951.1 diacylglycerol kinase family protein [Lachnospiraceae bacterium]